jgi:hypothetical protein
VTYKRWYFQTRTNYYSGLAPLDVRLGVVGKRVSPALAESIGRLAADMPQQAVIEQIGERFSVSVSVDAYRKIVDELDREIFPHQDQQAIEQLIEWIESARSPCGKHEVLLQVGRDGVHVPLRPGWRESACATLSVFDRDGKRLGTVYLGEAPRKDQLFMTRRLTTILNQVFAGLPGEVPVLRYVTDAGAVPQSYFKEVLSKMKHPCTGEPLAWSWGVDFYHACEYITKIAESLFGTDTEKSQQWSLESRHILRDDDAGVSKVIRRAAQQERRHGLAGKRSDYERGLGYLKKYGGYMDYAARRRKGEPIGSGITEAGCKVIFNQRLKQSGMRWNRDTMQRIINLRTACRSGIWGRIWKAILNPNVELPPITRVFERKTPLAA